MPLVPVDYDPFFGASGAAGAPEPGPLLSGAVGEYLKNVLTGEYAKRGLQDLAGGLNEGTLAQRALDSASLERATNLALALGANPLTPAANRLLFAAEGVPSTAGGNSLMAREYPMAPRTEWYGDANYENTGGRIVQMTPDEFLAQARPLKIEEVARENIDDLKNHIESGKTLDPLALYANGKEDGRHRAYAAKELGIEQVPVLTWRLVPVDHDPFAE